MYFLLKIVFVTFVICIVCGQEDLCYTPTQEEGHCISLDSCDQLKPLITKSRETLKQYHCGWEGTVPKVGSSGGTVPKVCCPSPGTTTPSRKDGTGSSEPPLPSDACFTLESKLGSCLPVQSCPHIVKMLATKSAQSLDYFQRSRCMGPEPKVMYVCCDSNINPSAEVISRDGACPPSALPPNPASLCCGTESFSGNKVIGGTETAIDQYPWLALIEYARPQLCGGSLISNKYVLTAAHCILNKANKPREVVAVLLGEYNTTNSGRDCVAVEGGGEDCTPGAIRVPVESAIPHPAYNTQKIVQFAHDIALLRLSQMVTFNDFIRPICLPTSDITKAPPMGMRFFVAGWGAVSETRPSSDIKLYTSLPYVNHEQCQSAFNTLRGSLIWEQQICAGGEIDKDTCKGDSGGPLMYESDKIHEVVGVVSFGLLQCGIKKPSVYTKVYDYLTWINANIKP
ncbi:phenoloxidase-activating enzyme-like isoform X2 [Maniola jurtina]|uniref:phenoloxidase-activating enzyme-like isoform X2 n=1 Tax=Maniola jurtina TaxID=191418 RepID=UPI001E688D7B|nr:phenoloxidase-activating enzyme-like isoform X2 [Maniola jurtina]